MEQRPALSFLFTSQTTTSAELVTRALHQDHALGAKAIHQFAPLDTPVVATRFVDHWSPDLAVFAEGEIWPNLLKQLRKRGLPTALINARMTEDSLSGWRRWASLSRELFGGFDIILAADGQTAEGLAEITGRDIPMPGNLKSALSLPGHDTEQADHLRKNFIGQRACLVAVSTHAGEEAFVLDALDKIARPTACVLVPRHPGRAPQIAEFIKARGMNVSRRSLNEPVSTHTHILLADTLGEVALFASLADTVYLGGGHAAGIGGHNPLEILRLGKPLATGPEVFNFADVKTRLEGETGYNIVATPQALADGFPFAPPTDALMTTLETSAHAPMDATIKALLPLVRRETSA